MAGAIAHVAVRDRHLLWRAALAAGASGGERAKKCDDDDDPLPRRFPRAAHGRDPIGWHIRHGIAPSGSLLDQPAGCGLPPTPPTL